MNQPQAGASSEPAPAKKTKAKFICNSYLDHHDTAKGAADAINGSEWAKSGYWANHKNTEDWPVSNTRSGDHSEVAKDGRTLIVHHDNDVKSEAG
jgi:hypothetical protein